MKMVIVKKTVLSDGYEYVDAHQVFDEFDPKTEEHYALAKCISDVLNYYQENTPDAFGNAPYARLEGFMYGYICGKKYELNREKDHWDVIKGKRIIMRVEVPKKHPSYYEAVKDNRERGIYLYR